MTYVTPTLRSLNSAPTTVNATVENNMAHATSDYMSEESSIGDRVGNTNNIMSTLGVEI